MIIKLSKIIFYVLFITFIFFSGCAISASPNENEPDMRDAIVRYVSPVGEGSKTGESKNNAADFSDPDFWDLIGKEISNEPIVVQFLAGEYGEAITENPLELERIGDPNHKLTLQGGEDVNFRLENTEEKSTAIDIRGAQNIVIDDFHFTGDGKWGYIIRITKLSDSDIPTTHITVQNSSFIDMEGIIYGISGAHHDETSYITYRNNTFKRVGIDAHSHFIYNAYGASHISIIDNHFEDCMGDFVRFRGNGENNIVKGSTFKKVLDRFTGRVFIMMPVFNDVDPGDEPFATNYAFVDNEFINNQRDSTENAISFYHSGYSPPNSNYLLTEEEGKILRQGSVDQKTNLLRDNFGIDPDKIRMYNNTFSFGITRKFTLETYAKYGAKNKGFEGDGEITATINTQEEPFDWEP